MSLSCANIPARNQIVSKETLDRQAIQEISNRALSAVSQAVSVQDLNEVRLVFLGKKGELSSLVKSIGKADPEKRKELGSLLNKAKKNLEETIVCRQELLSQEALAQELESEWIDVTLPLSPNLSLRGKGALHPVCQVEKELVDIFSGLGFRLVDGPELESDHFNFEALNIPGNHPARDMQDTFWTSCGSLLRTHTSCIQARALKEAKEKGELPLRIVAPGRVFRYERVDASHSHTFYQMEGMFIDKKVTVGNLTWYMRTLLREICGFDPKIRLRPGYFPFVEPGFELDIWFSGKWMELLPCGLVHPRVLEAAGIDSKEWQGFAFGLGLSRLVMSRYQVKDIRDLNSADQTWLAQFA